MCVPATLGSRNGSLTLRPAGPANSMTPLPWVLPLVLLMLAASLPVAVARGADFSDADPAATEEQPAVVTPTPRSEAEQDRIDATALFATGRAHEQRQDYEAALRYYQRAEQASPGTPAILRHIVVLAFNLDRRSEAARYAQLLVEPEPEDAPLLRRLGLELADEGNLQAALTLYRRVAKVQPDDKDKKPSANAVIWWMELGQLYYLTQQYADAAEQFAKVERALANPAEFHLTPQLEKILVGKGDETYRSFGDCYLEAGRLDDAQKAYDEANHHKANAELLAFGRARVAAARHEPAEALRQLELALAGDLSHEGSAPYELLAKILADLKQEDQLTVQLEKLRAAAPDNPRLTLFLADTYRQAGDVDRAEPLYRSLCDVARRQPAIDAWQGYISLLMAAKRWDELLGPLGTVLGQLGDWQPLGEAGKKLLADDAAVDALLEVARKKHDAGIGRDQAGPWLAAGMLSIHRKHYDDAEPYFELALSTAPAKTLETLLAWSLDLIAHEQYASAAEVLRRATDQQLAPAAAAAFNFYLSGALAMTDQTDQALAAARRAAELQPDSPRFQSRPAWILYHAKRYEDARIAYESLVNRFDDQPFTDEVREVLHDARLVLSNIAIYQNDPQRLETWLEQLWDEYPGDPGVLNDLGYTWADQGTHLERSLRMIRQAVEAEPKNLAYRDSLGWALYRLGRFPDAVVELRTACGGENPDPAVLDHLGDALLAAGQKDEALDVWRQAAAGMAKAGETEKGQKIESKIAAPPAPPASPAPAPATPPTATPSP